VESQEFTIPQSSSSVISSAQGASRSSTTTPTGPYTDLETINPQRALANQALQVSLPAEPLTEFQKFTASTTGLVLPIFGADLFRRVPSTFAPLNLVPVPTDYVLGPGDVLRIRVWGQVNFQVNLQVDRSGEIFIPQIGPVHVEGLSLADLDAHLRAAIGRVYHNFELTADVGQTRAIQVYVTGAARKPGVYTISALSTLVDALFASGGPSVEGSLRHIQLRRGNATITDFDLYDLLIRGDKSKDPKLLTGDILFIPPVGHQVAIIGSVRSPAVYELRDGDSLGALIAYAGGVSSVAAEARVSIERIEEHRYRAAMEVKYDEQGLATTLADGDLIRVYSVLPAFRNTVTLRGNTANPGRFAWRQGMRLSDLLPDKESLLTRNYWWKRAQLGLPGSEFEPEQSLADLRQPSDSHAQAIDLSASQAGVQGSQNGSAQQQTEAAKTEPGDATGSSRGQNPTAEQRTGGSSLAAAQSSQTARSYAQEKHYEVKLLAPEIDWDYAVIERLDPETLKTSLISFDLGKLVLKHDASQDLELQAGDVVTIFSEADIRVPVAEQTKLVRLDGEFAHAGVYSIQPGETLRQLVQRAGGLTPNAYLYGSEFTRVSTQAIQQARIDEYVQSLSLRTQRAALQVAASASAQAVASGSAAQSSEQNLLNSLKQIRATGRIVLSLRPDSSGVASIPDIPLEDGDRFVVPNLPQTVNVVGAVYNQNSFLFKAGSRAETFMHLAGGANKDADRKHEFIIRADGEVVARDLNKGLWGNEFEDLHIYPGDTIVVPEKTFKPSALYGIMNWSQIFSQLALGAVSLSVVQ
jgi:protein involved in polysaccharide export with SLBB domain